LDALARVEIDADDVHVIPVGLSKLWSLRRAVSIPLDRITEVHTFDEEGPWGGRVKAGVFRGDGVRAFLVVGRRRPVVVIECPGGRFDRAVFSAENPDVIVDAIARALPTTSLP
jgi:hypothetical protein